ncbi:MAG: MBL fold metallo-hydrolase, partial [Acidimicrobiales bacterium]|nr:MBL fold metallo-hydrolase [Acidimicrobiales bacterium]
MLLHWDTETILFDPGEGVQRQMLLAHEAPNHVTRVCIGHFHGDHCLGLPGFVQRRALQPAHSELRLHYPAWGRAYVDHLLAGSVIDMDLGLVHEPVGDGSGGPADTIDAPTFRLVARRLDHTVPAIGWRLEEAPTRHL